MSNSEPANANSSSHGRTQSLTLQLDKSMEINLPPAPRSCSNAASKDTIVNWQKVCVSEGLQWHSPKAGAGLNARTANISNNSLASTCSESCSEGQKNVFTIGTMNDSVNFESEYEHVPSTSPSEHRYRRAYSVNFGDSRNSEDLNFRTLTHEACGSLTQDLAQVMHNSNHSQKL
jgi:hypothetical protein